MKNYETATVSPRALLYQKITRIMKLTVAFMLLACLQVSANGWGQERITLKMNEAEIKKVLFAIEKKTEYRFLFTEGSVKGKPRVNLDVREATLPEVLDRVLANTGISYKLLGTNLVVLKEGVTIAEMTTQDIKVTGKVVSPSGEPMVGVSVGVKGSRLGTTTDANGNFSITVPDDAVLVISFVGYETQEQTVAGRATINITLRQSEKIEDAVVVVGYGTQRKRDLTGSINSVKGDEVSRMPSTNPISSLQGKVPGLTISNSGRAGSSPVVRIRGVNSTNSAGPLYVVDGTMTFNIDFLNPADIETFDILRDPSSIAIYGLQGANGVIAITTKKASRGQTRINLQSNVGFQKVNDKISITDAAGFRKLYTAQLQNLNAAPFDYTNYTANTNWQDLVLQTAMITSHSLSVSNSGDKSTTYFNIGYTNQEGVLKYDRYERFMVRVNEEIKFTNNIKVGADVTGYHYNATPPAASITNALWAAPIVPIQVNENTYYSMPSFQRAQVGNPIANLNRNHGNTIDKGYRVLGSVFGEIKFLRSFTWKSTFYTDMMFGLQRVYTQLPFSFVNLGEGATPTTTTFDNTVRTAVTQEQNESRRFQQDHTLTFDKKFGSGHTINAVAGYTTVYNIGSFVNANRRDTAVNIPDNPDFWYINIANANNPGTFGGGGSENSVVGAFGRVAYNYKGKYLLNATVRRDGSSKFAPENRWGTFGSIGIGWVVTTEDFMSNVKLFNYLKVRASYGVLGNSNGVPDNVWRPGISNASTAIFGDNIYTSIQSSYIPDPDLHWEKVRGINIGFDATMLANRLSLEATYYDRATIDLITPVTIPNDTRSKITNLGEVTNKGVELILGWKDKIGRDLTYAVNANVSYNQNKVETIGDNINFQLVGNGGANLTTTGRSIGYFFGYTQSGIYQSTADLTKIPAFINSLPGDISYRDINGDGLLTTADRGYLGTPFPPYSFGGSISLGYKGFDLEIQGQGMTGHKIYTQRRTATFAVLNYETMRENAWTTAGSTNVEPILDNTRGNNFLMSTYYLEPGDFFRIRTLQLGYTFSKETLGKLPVKAARIYLSGQNVKTWSRVTGYSPEPLIGSILGGGADNGAYPVPAIYSLGLNLTF